jgi:hypothetical protein
LPAEQKFRYLKNIAGNLLTNFLNWAIFKLGLLLLGLRYKGNLDILSKLPNSKL